MIKTHLRTLLPWIVLVGLLSLSLFSWGNLRQFIKTEQEKEFTLLSEEVTIRFEDRIKEYFDILYAIQALFEVKSTVSRDDFGTFLTTQKLQKRYPGIQALEFAEYVKGEELDNFIERVQMEIEGFTVHPESQRDEYYVVNYIEPFAGNEQAFGLDLAFEENRRTALEFARDNNEKVITSPITLVQETESQTGVLIIFPVYQMNQNTETVEKRQQALQGFAIGVFRIDDMVSNILNSIDSSDKINLTIYDSSDDLDEEMLIFTNIENGFEQKTQISTSKDIPITGRTWRINYSPSPNFFTSSDAQQIPNIVLGFGSIISILVFFILYTFNRTQKRAVSLAKELTQDLKKFQLAVANASDHIVITDPKGKIIYANKAAEKITGYVQEEMIGKTPATWGRQMDDKFYKKMWSTLAGQKKTFVAELTNKRKNGVLYQSQTKISPILNEKKEFLFYVGVERDITKEKEIDKAKTEFVSLASHQLRTPLSTINWYVEMLLDNDAGNINEEQKEYLQEIHISNKRMIELVTALLNVSRIELGTFAVEPKPTDIVEISDSVLEELVPQIKEKKLRTTKKYDSQLDKKMSFDPNLIGIVFQNLLSNAVKYTPEGGQVDLIIQKRKSDILVTIKDTGYGIPKKTQSKIFTKMFRADNVKTKDTTGSGLGLYIVKSILEQSQGKIWFESEENKGSTFYFTIPTAGMTEKAGTRALT